MSDRLVNGIIFGVYAALSVASFWEFPERSLAFRVGHVAGLLVLTALAYHMVSRRTLSRTAGIIAFTSGWFCAPGLGFGVLMGLYLLQRRRAEAPVRPAAPLTASPPPGPIAPPPSPPVIRSSGGVRTRRGGGRPAAAPAAAASTLLIDEYFDAGDPRLLDELLACRSDQKLAALAEPWWRDARPFARELLLRYIDDGCDRPNHKPLVKRLFKKAEAAGDDEVMAHFLVAFDRLVHRELYPTDRGYRFWRKRRQGIPYVLLSDRSVPDRVYKNVPVRQARDPQTGQPIAIPMDVSYERFSRRTRMYLERRAFRYFRAIGRTDAARYGRAVRATLALYQDQNLQKPEQLLDAWGLLHALYWSSPVIRRHPTGARLAPGRALSELSPAPLHPEAWKGCLDELFQLLDKARSRTVRAWTLALLRRDYAPELRGMPVARIRALLRSAHDEVLGFGAELLRTASGLEALTVAEWLELLRLESPAALGLVSDLLAKHVHPQRLTLAQCVDLACAAAAPVAELGLRWTREKPIGGEEELRASLALGRARVARVRAEAAAWLAERIAASPAARPEHVRELMDSLHADVRAKALELMAGDARFRDSLDLWTALSESPYDDARSHLVRHLRSREAVFAPGTLRHVWASALLAIHRGGRAKRQVVGQVGDRIVRHPGEADSLLPLLAVALRSVRLPERRSALAALSRAAFRSPGLRRAIEHRLPELKLFDEAPA